MSENHKNRHFTPLYSCQKRQESGATLMFALGFTLLFASMLLILSQNQTTQSQVLRADSTGWQISEIAKAARLYVRNNAFGGGSLGDDGVDLAANPSDPDFSFEATFLFNNGPQEIFLEDLVNAGYLPDAFLQTGNRVNNVGAGSVAQTVYGQNIRVFAANTPIDLDPADANNFVVPTAYIVLESSPQVTPAILRTISASISNYGINFASPLFDAGGTNISDDCDGAAAVAIWDSGCLNQAQYDTTFGTALGSTFSEGDLVIPAWRVVTVDSQIVSRFPQPGNANYATMITDLLLGTCEATNLQVIQETQSTPGVLERVDSEVCDSLPDNIEVIAGTPSADNRVDLLGVRSMDVNRVIASDQNVDREIPDGTRTTTDEHVAYVLSGGTGSIANDYNDLTFETDAEVQDQLGTTTFLDDGIDGDGDINTRDIDDTLLLSNIILSPTTSATIPGNLRVFSLQRPDSLPSANDDLTDYETGFTLPMSTQNITVNGTLSVSDDRDANNTSDIVLGQLITGELTAFNLSDQPDGATLQLNHDISLNNLTVLSNLNISGDYFTQIVDSQIVQAKNLTIAFGSGGTGLTTTNLVLDGLDEGGSPLTYTGGNVAIVPEMTLPSSSVSGALSNIATPTSSGDATAAPGNWPLTIIGENLNVNSRLVIQQCERDCPEY